MRVVVAGRVQGVGFRAVCLHEAQALGIGGWVRNRPDGRVEAVFDGAAAAVDRMVEWCRHGPRHAHVAGVEVHEETPIGEPHFHVR